MKKGFTIVELLAVIVVLAAIFLVVTPMVNKSVKNGRIKSQADKEKIIISSAERYVIDNGLTDQDILCISMSDLKTNGYMKNESIHNVVTGVSMDSYYVKATKKTNGEFSYTLDSTCTLE